MGILLVILQILTALPQVIHIVQEIIHLIFRQPPMQRHELLVDLEHILKGHVDSGCDEEACRVDLEKFKEHLVEKYG